jgi:hypothetical protein
VREVLSLASWLNRGGDLPTRRGHNLPVYLCSLWSLVLSASIFAGRSGMQK